MPVSQSTKSYLKWSLFPLSVLLAGIWGGYQNLTEEKLPALLEKWGWWKVSIWIFLAIVVVSLAVFLYLVGRAAWEHFYHHPQPVAPTSANPATTDDASEQNLRDLDSALRLAETADREAERLRG